MIKLVKQGTYKLIETKHNTKILYLDHKTYAWVEIVGLGEILIASHKAHKTDCVLGVGEYHIYDVIDEPTLSDQLHLELEVGHRAWQGYLLLTGLPTATKKRKRIVPTREIIAGNPAYRRRKETVKL